MTSDQVEETAGSTQDPLIGTVFAERYEIISRLGEGGMSIVYKARHQLMKKLVVIKMLQAHQVAKLSNIKRFQQEAQAVAALDHPNIINVSDFGVTDSGQPYLIMDYLEGLSLSDLLHKEGRLAVERALHILLQASDALAHAHSKGIIHRDLKPSNIMIVQHEKDPDFVKIVDFGIAKLLPQEGEEHHQLTQTGEVFGSPLYMSPEQCTGAKLDGRSDIYSFGCVMYETFTSQPPFKGSTPLATIHMQTSQIAEPLSIPGCGSRLLSNLDAIVFKAQEKDPDKRYQSMADLHSDLKQVSQDSTANLLGTVPRTGIARTVRRFQSWIRSHPLAAAAVTAGVLLALGTAFWLMTCFIPLLEPITLPRQEISWVRPESLAKGDIDVEKERFLDALIRRQRNNGMTGSAYHVDRLKKLIAMYVKAGMWNKAADNLRDLRDIEVNQDTEDNFVTADISMLLVRCYLNAEIRYNLPQQQKMCEQAISVYSRLFGEDASRMAVPYFYYGEVLAEQRKASQAEVWYQKAVAQFKKGSDRDSYEMPLAYCRLADIRRNEGNFRASAPLYDEALPLWKNANAQSNAALCQFYLAHDFAQMSLFDQADNRYREALKSMEDTWGSDSTNLIGFMLDYEQFLEKRNRWIEALQLKSRIRDLIAGLK